MDEKTTEIMEKELEFIKIVEKNKDRFKKIHEKLIELSNLGCSVTQMSGTEIKVIINYES